MRQLFTQVNFTLLPQKLAFVTAGVVVSFTAIEANPVKPVLAATVTYDFTVDVTSGSLAGTQGFGFFSYDDSTLTGSGLETLGVNEDLTISFNFSGKVYNEADDVGFPYFPFVQFQDNSFLGLSFFRQKPEFAFRIGTSSSDPKVYGGNEFRYGARPDIDGEGIVNYSPRPVPEPSAIFGLLLGGCLLLKKLKPSVSFYQ